MDPKVFSAIDIGSNTIRLLVARDIKDAPETLAAHTETVRLAHTTAPGAPLAPDRAAHALDVIARYARISRRLGASGTLAVATQALREAADGPAFVDRIRVATGIKARIIAGEEEARLSASAAVRALGGRRGEAVFFDLGGASTEFAMLDSGQVGATASLPLGVVRLTRQLAPSDPPSPGEMAAVRAAAGRLLGLLPAVFPAHPGRLIGAAGTVTTLAALHLGLEEYDPGRVSGLGLSRARLAALENLLTGLDTAGRGRLPGVPSGRADIIHTGALIVGRLMDYFNSDELTISDAGLLMGVWLAASGKIKGVQDD